MPVGFAILALRLVWKSSDLWTGRAIAGFGIVLGLWIGASADSFADRAATPWLVLILASTLLGGPIFAALGGAAVFLFLSDFVPLAAIPAESYRLAVSPTLAAIPLFTLTGFLLAEGGASERLLRVFRALFGWVPGSTPVVCAVVCAFFTVFTGGSGVTILALGGVLFAALSADGYRERFSLGLLTSSGSLGLLLPPALPLILYGIVAEVPIEDLFIGGLVPGLLLVALIAAWGVREGLRGGARRFVFSEAELGRALWAGKWELFLPVVVLGAFFSGYATLVETAALAALYAFVIQCLVHRDVKLGRPLMVVFRQCAVLVGGVLIILVAAMGLTSWLVDAQAAQALVELVQNNIESKIVFLLALNVFLLLVGCLMDIFSATVVVVPLIIPLGLAFGVDPIHLGIIFVANLELGYLTPPVGLNLFLASYRFERPLLAVYRAAVPALVILGVGVLLITYVPGLTLGLLDLLGRT
ncbi:MAG: TRAP transporter large permease subunit [Holophagales bacterium]|nr:TRAP transporter large permease subunit [Holophagales bacterium]MYJ25566.1 TRAP transporter large permease subunit [Holophagales bacterium]